MSSGPRRPSGSEAVPPTAPGVAYWALAEVVRGTFDIVDTDDVGVAWRKLDRGIADLVASSDTEGPTERIAALGRPLGIEPPGADGADSHDHDDPQQMRDQPLRGDPDPDRRPAGASR